MRNQKETVDDCDFDINQSVNNMFLRREQTIVTQNPDYEKKNVSVSWFHSVAVSWPYGKFWKLVVHGGDRTGAIVVAEKSSSTVTAGGVGIRLQHLIERRVVTVERTMAKKEHQD